MSLGWGMEPGRNVIATPVPDKLKSTPAVCMIPLRATVNDPGGFGAESKVKVALTPSIVPVGVTQEVCGVAAMARKVGGFVVVSTPAYLIPRVYQVIRRRLNGWERME